MSASDHLGRQFKLNHDPPMVTGHWEPHPHPDYPGHQHWVDEDPAQGRHMLTAHTGNNKPLGIMKWSRGVVDKVKVYDTEKWGRQGMATQMWHKAQEITPGLRHSDNRTEMGNSWAEHVGGIKPERMQDHPEWFQ